jgi:hypothetical protein
LNLVEATRHLKSTPKKTIVIKYLKESKRLKGRLSIFNPLRDAKDLCALIGTMIA